jgi:glutamyl-tRNA reductase
MEDTISKIGCISTKIGKAGIELLEALTIPEPERREKIAALKDHMGVAELIYIATCNRVEIIILADSPINNMADLRNRMLDFFFKSVESTRVDFEPDNFRLFLGREAVKHIFAMAASLDSVVIGEAQILGQVKEAHRIAGNNGLSGVVLERLMAAAFKAAKIVRSETELGKRPVSMSSLVALRLGEIITDMPDAVIAIVGAGPMTSKMAKIIRSMARPLTGRKKYDNRLLFVNRTPANVELFATNYDGRALNLNDFLEGREKVNIIISATSSPEPIFTVAGLRRLMIEGQKLFGFDMAIPRDFSVDTAQCDFLEIWNIEKLNQLAQKNRRERFRTVDQADRIIESQVKQYLQKEFAQMISPSFDSALDESLNMVQEGLAGLFKGKLSHLSSDDQELLLHWSKKVIARACYLPARQLAEQLAGAEGKPSPELSPISKRT